MLKIQNSANERASYSVPESYLENATKDTATFLFQQAEKCLIETLESDKLITDRSYRLLAMLIPSTIAVLIYDVNALNEYKFDLLLLLSIVTTFFLFIALLQNYHLLKGKQLYLNGSTPSKLTASDCLNMYNERMPKEDMPENEILKWRLEKQVIGFYIWELQNFETRIEHNRNENKRRNGSLDSILKRLVWMVVVNINITITYFFHRWACLFLAQCN